MSADSRPIVLFVDDHPDEIAADSPAAISRVRAPSDVDLKDLQESSLVLVDYRLDEWVERDKAACLALQPSDGLALAAVLRSHATESLTAFAIHSAHLSDLSGGLPPQSREHVIASANNLEWVFAKPGAADRERWITQITSLAEGVQRLPRVWPQELLRAEEKLAELLAIPAGTAWTERAISDVRACRPPLHELSLWTHGIAIIRWLLHRILPYPCFLSTIEYVAARLRVTTPSLDQALRGKSKLADAFAEFEYRGIMREFLGRRWWRVAVENFLWEVTGGRSADLSTVRRVVLELAPDQLVALESDFPVVCVDRDYRVLPNVANSEHAVRIRPDDWPPYSDDAWTTIELAKAEPTLAAMVIEADRYRLERS